MPGTSAVCANGRAGAADTVGGAFLAGGCTLSAKASALCLTDWLAGAGGTPPRPGLGCSPEAARALAFTENRGGAFIGDGPIPLEDMGPCMPVGTCDGGALNFGTAVVVATSEVTQLNPPPEGEV